MFRLFKKKMLFGVRHADEKDLSEVIDAVSSSSPAIPDDDTSYTLVEVTANI